ncbi:CAP domain-containing protein [Clostridium sp.]|uniref:CAP domain-containing protein n=1 Tax=Clostridium sp. TaxID=1506 RepID=UPI0028460FB8|nr:CAP domain-containing protein [Clostridium sp.]MDR3597535.1 CAP domain-containing protein [Clostridium sp.]
MKKAFLKKTVIAAIAATTMTTLVPLGVSAATINSAHSNYYNLLANSISNRGWINNNGNLNYLSNLRLMQTGVNINGNTYNLNPNDATGIENVTANNNTYTCPLSGQVVESNTPIVSNQNNNLLTTANASCPNSIGIINNSGSIANAGSTTTSENTTSAGNTSTGTTANIGSTTTSGTTTNATTSVTSIDVQGLSKLPTNYSISIQNSAEDQILQLMNQKRVEAGLKPLTLDNTLIEVARYKSDDMIQNNFFDHTNPDGTKWTNWLQALGYNYTTAGENIAYNNYDAVQLFTQWWNSPGHRANMMNASYTKVGIGVIYGSGKYMGTQEFSN